MSFRHDKNYEFEVDLTDVATPEWNASSPAADAARMRELHQASVSVLRLATRAHDAVARGDALRAEETRASLERQLALTTRLIDEMLFNDSDSPMTH
ncbi:hypothetical protein AAGS40_16940 [Paraburkholderia sp. PREW-6R]|uniref:hypothetical protein n=1 Tax=Paraburkholderia sp. PREW-6R TaxID=3141544 RepID=UPI0031F57B62